MDIQVSEALAKASPLGAAHLGLPITAGQIAMIPPDLKIGDWQWPTDIDPVQFAEKKWLPHYMLATDILPPYGWLGATLFYLPPSEEGGEVMMGSKIWWLSRHHFREIQGAPEKTPMGDIWKQITGDLNHPRWGGRTGKRWEEPLAPGMIIIAGDPLPPFPEGEPPSLGGVGMEKLG